MAKKKAEAAAVVVAVPEEEKQGLRRAHNNSAKAVADAIGFAMEAGQRAVQVREDYKPAIDAVGGWEKWVAANLPDIAYSTLGNYERLWKNYGHLARAQWPLSIGEGLQAVKREYSFGGAMHTKQEAQALVAAEHHKGESGGAFAPDGADLHKQLERLEVWLDLPPEQRKGRLKRWAKIDKDEAKAAEEAAAKESEEATEAEEDGQPGGNGKPKDATVTSEDKDTGPGTKDKKAGKKPKPDTADPLHEARVLGLTDDLIDAAALTFGCYHMEDFEDQRDFIYALCEARNIVEAHYRRLGKEAPKAGANSATVKTGVVLRVGGKNRRVKKDEIFIVRVV